MDFASFLLISVVVLAFFSILIIPLVLIPLTIYVTLLLLVLSFLMLFLHLYYKNLKSKSLPPGPTPLPYFGCIVQFCLNKPTFRWIHKVMEDMNTKIACIRIGQVHIIAVTSPEIAREFLKANDSKVATRPLIMSANITSGGFLSTALAPLGEHWMKMRKLLTLNILSNKMHNLFLGVRTEEEDHLVRYVYNQCSKINPHAGGIVNVRVATQHFCGNMIRRLIFSKRFFGTGAEDGGPGKEEIEHVSAAFGILKYLFAFCLSDYFSWLRFRFDMDDHEKIIKKHNKSMRKYQDPLVDERIREWENKSRVEKEDFLDYLIDAQNPKLTASEIKAQLHELIIATVDNPSNTAEWALAEMINEPILLQRATEELDREVGRDRLVQEVDIPKLNYIKACVKEAMRLHPIAPFNPSHVSRNDMTVAGYFIPEGSHILISRPGLGRDPCTWEEPLKFTPERHLNTDNVSLADHDLNMLSFSTGRRGCPGIVLGSTITIMLLARLIHAFTWEVPSDAKGIDLSEGDDELLMDKPLVLMAKPRLPLHLYQAS